MKRTVAVGHHGTSKAAATTILSKGFSTSKNSYDWLGDGAYFFQDAPIRALEWATKRFGVEAIVVECRIEIRDFIDLLDVAWASWLADVHDRLVEELRQAGKTLPSQRGKIHSLDRHVLNYGIQLLESDGYVVRGVRGAFVEGTPAFPNSALFTLTHVQIAVRDLSLISRTRTLTAEEIRRA